MLKVRVQSWQEREQKGISRSNVKQVGAWHSPTTMFEMSEFEFFSTKITQVVNEIFKEQKYHENYIAQAINMWVNVNPKHAYNRSHKHPGSLWSYRLV